MPKPNRSEVIKPDVPGLFHVITQCVRQLYIMGKDHDSDDDKSHRRDFVIERVRYLAKYFAISVCWRAILENHLHLILGNLPQLVKTWSNEEVICRSCRIFPYKFGRLGVQDCEPTEAQLEELTSDADLVKEMRLRLSSPSWFMRQVLHPLAVSANKEDEVSGHFVSGPFEAIPITDKKGLRICGIYIDLNEIRAKLADRPEESIYTSAGDRIMGRQLRRQGKEDEAAEWDGYLLPIGRKRDGQHYTRAGDPGALRATDSALLDCDLDDYLRVLDAAGRILHPKKRGKIPDDLPPILERLDLNLEELETFIRNYRTLFRNCIGSADSMARYAKANKRRISSISEVREIEEQHKKEEPTKTPGSSAKSTGGRPRARPSPSAKRRKK